MALTGPAAPAFAQSGDPAPACRVTLSALAFGAYDPQAPGPADSAGAAIIDCTGTGDAPLPVTLLAGSGQAQSAAARVMIAGDQVLLYNLYRDAARQQVWGDASNGHAPIAVTIARAGAPVRVDFYGRIPARQNVSPGVYRDTILVTLVF